MIDEDSGGRRRPDTFGTCAAPFALSDAVDIVFRLLLPDVISYAGPDGVAKLRTFPSFRRRIADLSSIEWSAANDCGWWPPPSPPGSVFPHPPSEAALRYVRGEGGDNPFAATRVGGRRRASEDVRVVAERLRPVLLTAAVRDGGSSGGDKKSNSSRLLVAAAAQQQASRKKVGRGLVSSTETSSVSSTRLSHPESDDDHYTCRFTDLALLTIARSPWSSDRALVNVIEALRRRRSCMTTGQINHGTLIPKVSSPRPPLKRLHGRIVLALADSPMISDWALDRLLRCTMKMSDENTDEINGGCSDDGCDDCVDDAFVLRVLERIASHPSVGERSQKFLAELNSISGGGRSNDGLRTVRTALARNQNARSNVLSYLASTESVTVLMAVGRNLRTPPDILAHLLLTHDREEVRCAAAENVRTPPEALRDAVVVDTLECNGGNVGASDTVRMSISGNPSVPVDILSDVLSRDAHWSVRCKVANNPSTNSDTLRRLATEDDVETVRLAAAMNPYVPSGLFDGDCIDDPLRQIIAAKVSRDARVLDALSTRLDETKHERVHEHLALNPCASTRLLAKLATSSSDRIRMRVALNPSASLRLLNDVLSKDHNVHIRALAAGHANATPDLLTCLALSDVAWEVKEAVAKNPTTPTEGLMALWKQTTPALPATGWTDMETTSGARHMSELLAAHPNIPPEVLSTLSSATERAYPIKAVRQMAASHPHLPAFRLVELSSSDDFDLVEGVASNPLVQKACDELSCDILPLI